MFVVKVPGINGLGRTKGCETAGNAILKAIDDVWSNLRGKPVDKRLFDLEEIHLNNSNVSEAQDLIYKNAYESFELKEKVIFLGGDHSISFPIVKAFSEINRKSGRECCLIVFDAHPDCMKPEKEPTHEAWLRAVVESGFEKGNIMVIGLRNSSFEETEFLNKEKIKKVHINEFSQDIQGITDMVMEFSQGKEAYLSIDIDVVDPSFAPGTGYIEPGGLTSREILYISQRMALLKNLKGIDLVEINPLNDKDGMTVKLGAKILAEFV